MTNTIINPPQHEPQYRINLPLGFFTTQPTLNCGMCRVDHTSYGQYGYCDVHYNPSLIKVCPNTGQTYYDHPEGTLMYIINQSLNHGCSCVGCYQPHN